MEYRENRNKRAVKHRNILFKKNHSLKRISILNNIRLYQKHFHFIVEPVREEFL